MNNLILNNDSKTGCYCNNRDLNLSKVIGKIGDQFDNKIDYLQYQINNINKNYTNVIEKLQEENNMYKRIINQEKSMIIH